MRVDEVRALREYPGLDHVELVPVDGQHVVHQDGLARVDEGVDPVGVGPVVRDHPVPAQHQILVDVLVNLQKRRA